MKKYLILIGLAGITLATSCSSKLDIAPPNNITNEQFLPLLDSRRDQITTPMVSGLTAAIASNMDGGEVRYQNWTTYEYTQSLRGNDLVFASEGQTWNFDEYRFVNVRGVLSDKNLMFWKGNYLKIGPCNQALMFLDEITPDLGGATPTAAQTTLKKNKAIALVARSFYYLNLIQIYQDAYARGGATKDGVPLQITYYESPASEIPKVRAQTSAVYAQIISDLSEAVKLYDNGGVTPTDTKNDFDQNVARALLMRAYLLTDQYANVVSTADEILANLPAGMQLMDESQYTATDASVAINAKNTAATCATGTGFMIAAKNPEAILMYNYNQVGSNSSFIGWTNIFGDNAGQGGSRGGYAAIDARLYDQIADDDYRKKNFLASSYEGGVKYYYPTDMTERELKKYYNTKFSSIGKHPSVTANNTQWDECFIRLSEVYLSKAEAQLKGTGLGDWKTTINTLVAARTRGGSTIDTYQTAAWYTGMTDLQKLQLQWRIEFWGEQGWEWRNNKRWDIGVDRVSAGPTGTASTHTDSRGRVQLSPGTEFTFQIPQLEMNYNPLCTQNP